MVLAHDDPRMHHAIAVKLVELASQLPEVTSRILKDPTTALHACDDALCHAQMLILSRLEDKSGLTGKA